MREQSPSVWILRVHLGRDRNGTRRDVSRTFRGEKRAATAAFADLVREIPKLQAERLNKTHHVVTISDLVECLWTLNEFDWAPNTIRDNRNVIDLRISTGSPIAANASPTDSAESSSSANHTLTTSTNEVVLSL